MGTNYSEHLQEMTHQMSIKLFIAFIIVVKRFCFYSTENHEDFWINSAATKFCRDPMYSNNMTSKYGNFRISFLIRVIPKVFTLSFTPIPLFQWYPQSKDILLNLHMKCWNSAFNAQGSRVTIVVVQVGSEQWKYM